ncbi:envelope stress response protein PspG [Pantoea sp. SIMBA_079]|uniref:envelope stress response protein PspG n=1 Tax=Pantoea TaxID=53335 RepID=UPI00080F3D39|nr:MULTISPECIES: envelope stress response protein PspG [Pantoea]
MVFVLGFFLMLLLTGVSLLGVIAALAVATALMFLTGLFAFVIKLLPWLLLAVVAVWLWRHFTTPGGNARLNRLKRKISRMERRGW